MTPSDYVRHCYYRLRENEKQWEQTRCIIAAFTGKKPTEIIKLSCDVLNVTMTDELRQQIEIANKKWV